MKLVSIITPAYNAEKFIKETILSVQNQTYQNWEMIIVDDISTDNTVKTVQEVSKIDPRVKIHQLPNKGGPAVARNYALDLAKGKYIAFLDADDIWLPNKLSVQLDFMEKNNAHFVFSQFRRFTDDTENTGRLIPIPKQVSYDSLLKHNVIATLTTLIDREKTGPLKMVDEGYDDFILWLDILKRIDFAYGIQEDLARYRIVSGSVSSKKLRAAKWVWNIYRNVEKLSLPRTLYTFAHYAKNVSLKHSRF